MSNHFLTDEYVEDALYKLFHRWSMSAVNEIEVREELYKHAQALIGFKKYLNDLETDRKMIEREQESPS